MNGLSIPLHGIAHARAGDKGDRLSIALFPYHEAFYPVLVEQVTEAAVARQFAHRRPRAVTRYLVPAIHGLNFVLDGALEGGVNRSLCLDRHGKALSYLLLELAIAVPGDLAGLIDVHVRRPQ